MKIQSLRYHLSMSTPWLIVKVCPEKETVHLVKSGTNIRRKFSVPGAVDAWFHEDYLMISSDTGYLWKITPENGHRRRDMPALNPKHYGRASENPIAYPV